MEYALDSQPSLEDALDNQRSCTKSIAPAEPKQYYQLKMSHFLRKAWFKCKARHSLTSLLCFLIGKYLHEILKCNKVHALYLFADFLI